MRGMDLKTLATEDIPQKQQNKAQKAHLKANIGYAFLGVYFIFFALFYQIIKPWRQFWQEAGIFAQLIFVLFIAFGLQKLLAKLPMYIPLLQKPTWRSMMFIFAFVCVVLAMVAINHFTLDFYKLAQ